MIKTMLLTAQLALSPIVGTNGLQPKRLANPVYGETTDYSVTYDGRTFDRVMSGHYYAYNIQGGTDLYFGYMIGKEQEVASDNLDFTTNSNFVLNSTDYYIYWQKAGENNYYTIDEIAIGDAKCLSWWQRENDYLSYNELFQDNDSGLGTLWRAKNWSKANGVWIQDSEESDDLPPNIMTGTSLFTYCPISETLNWGTWHRAIPENQPTIANPSVYDNIYNFYYENLFANEALEELNAEVGNNSLTMRQWLAHTATIVSISLLAVALAVLVIKIFKLIAGSLSDIWG